MGRCFVLAALLTLVAASAPVAQPAYGCHPSRVSETRVNLDGDPEKEQVIAAESHDCGHTSFTASVVIRDRCRGAWRTYDLGSEANFLDQFRIVNADGRTRRPEVFFVTRRVGVVARGVAAIVRLDSRPRSCSRLRVLFRYEPTAAGVHSFDIELVDAAPQYPGLEVLVTEAREVEQHVTKYRYDAARDRYVVYR
jgi:hypothetical protein